MIPYLVCEFSKPTVTNLVKECFGSDFPDIFIKPQLNYIYHYLTDLGARTVLLEREYLDKDYLEDFSRYYVKCFNNGGTKCARLHFFKSVSADVPPDGKPSPDSIIDHSYLGEVLAKGNESEKYRKLQDAYLGFVVIKPLPMTFVGKTCLQQYPGVRGPGEYVRCLSKEYQIDLFGIELRVHSVAFQEQDRVVSACATTAIWGALHAIRWNSNLRRIPACSEITTNAINHIDGSHNSFPNKGLTNKQILRALDVEGLRYYNETLENVDLRSLLDTARCHIDSGVPLILGVKIHDADGNELGGHAVTILGYKSDGENSAFYIHDDRLGPFARATFETIAGRNGLALRRKTDKGTWEKPHELLVPSSLIAPNYKKVRIPYTLPRNTCKVIQDEFEEWIKSGGGRRDQYKNALRFSLQLEQISDIRKELINYPYSQNDKELIRRKVRFLTGSYARFQWVAAFTFQGQPAFKILFDATDIPQGNAISEIFIQDERQAEPVLAVLRQYAKSIDTGTQNESFFGAVLRYLRTTKPGLSDHLDRTYGELRAPKYLKEGEIEHGQIGANDSVQVYYEATASAIEERYAGVAEGDYLIWAIAEDGGLLVGKEIKGRGHPSLTGFKPARIAGELKRTASGWEINSKSGRYSGDYANASGYLTNATNRIRSVFPRSEITLPLPVS